MSQVPYLSDTDVVATFHRENDLFSLVVVAIVKEQPTVNPLVSALLHLLRSCAYLPQRPYLKLELIILRELLGLLQRGWFPDDCVGLDHILTECVQKAALDEGYGKLRHVNANPAAFEKVSGRDGCAAPAEWVE